MASARFSANHTRKLHGISYRVTYCLLTLFVFGMTIVCIGFTQKSLIVIFYTPTGYLCPYFRGGLGNLMFQYASLYGIAKTKHMTLVLETKDHISSVFPKLNVKQMTNSSSICGNATVFPEVKPCAYNIETFNYDRRKHIRQKGYLQSWKYFIKYESDIRRQFVFKPEVQTKAQEVINKCINDFVREHKNSTHLQVIGVHIRRGDYLKQHNIKFGYNVVTKEYIEKALSYFRSRFDNCLFIVFTGPNPQDIKWRTESVNGSDVIHVTPNSREVDMCALSKCNHTIVTVGSFGWWSAWLANGITVYYKDVARQNSSLRKDFSPNMTDFFPPNWIGL